MMEIREAIELCARKYPGRIPVGYWKRQNKIILNTKSVKNLRGLTAPSQFVVTPDGKVYGANPIEYGLTFEDMIKIK